MPFRGKKVEAGAGENSDFLMDILHLAFVNHSTLLGKVLTSLWCIYLRCDARPLLMVIGEQLSVSCEQLNRCQDIEWQMAGLILFPSAH